MAWIWKNGPCDRAERLMLLALADHADDKGWCFPSMARLAEKTCMTERGARKVIRRLEVGGWLAVQIGGGRGGKSLYRVLMDEKAEHATRNAVPVQASNPEQETRKSSANPERTDRKPGTIVPPNHQGTISKAALPRARVIEQFESTGLTAELIRAVGLPRGTGNPDGSIAISRLTAGDVAAHFAIWRNTGLHDDQILAAIAGKCAAMRTRDPNFLPRNLKYFDGPVRDHAARLNSGPSAFVAAPAGQTERDRRMAFYRRVAGGGR